MKALLAALVLVATEAPAQQVVRVTGARLVQLDGGLVEVGSGAWKDDLRLVAEGAEHADLRARNTYLQEHAADMPIIWVWVALAVGGGIGLACGFAAGRASR